MSTNKHQFRGQRAHQLLCLGLFALFSCDVEPVSTLPGIQLQFALSSDRGCSLLSDEELSASFDRLLIQARGNDAYETVANIVRTVQPGQELVIENIPADTTGLRLVGCLQGEARWSGEAPIELDAFAKDRVQFRLAEPGVFNCTRQRESEVSGLRFDWSAPAAFAVWGQLTEGIHLWFGGAQSYDGSTESLMGQAADGWDAYSTSDNLFFDGISRSERQQRKPLDRSRIGAVTAPMSKDGRQGLAIIGGASILKRNIQYAYGPLEPGQQINGAFSSTCNNDTSAVFFEEESRTITPIAPAEKLAQRFLAGAATEDLTTVIAGGLECIDSTYEPSDLIEVIQGNRVRTAKLGVRLLGSTVTALGDNKFLVWGYDIDNCGAQPGWMITVGNVIEVSTLTNVQGTGTGTCLPANGSNCTVLSSTAYHTATRLPDDEQGIKRVLVVGGISGSRDAGPDGAGRLTNTPALNESCGGNSIIVAIDRAGTGQIRPIDFGNDSPTPLRAFHRAVRSGRDVVISGGWLAGVESEVTCVNAADCADGACLGNRCTLGLPNPGALLASDRWFVFENKTQSVSRSGSMAQPRWGHLSASSGGGRVVVSGGLNSVGGIGVSNTTEFYKPPLDPNICRAPVPNSAIEDM